MANWNCRCGRTFDHSVEAVCPDCGVCPNCHRDARQFGHSVSCPRNTHCKYCGQPQDSHLKGCPAVVQNAMNEWQAGFDQGYDVGLGSERPLSFTAYSPSRLLGYTAGHKTASELTGS